MAEVLDKAARTATERGASAVAAELAEQALRLTPAERGSTNAEGWWRLGRTGLR